MNRIITLALLVAALACASADHSPSGDAPDWNTVVDTIGDTIVTRTTGGSDTSGTHTLETEVAIGELEGADEYTFGGINELEAAEDGRVYLFDRQVPALREYDAAGKYVRTIGRKGAGPGEYTQANGVGIHRDGRVVLWDAATAHINVYGPDGTFRTSWMLPGGSGFYTSGALFVDTAGNTYARTRIADPPKNAAGSTRPFGTTGLVMWDRNGSIVDSLSPPPQTMEPQSLVATQKGGMSVYSLPFAPRDVWAWSPLGYFVSARTDRYVVTLSLPDGRIRRLERDVPTVPVTGDERTDQEERITASLRMTDPTWRWSGPSIPSTKPPIAALAVADDGRIWVSVSQPGERIPEGELPAGPSVRAGTGDFPRPPPPKWRDPIVYDVFDPSGRYLGRVPVPPRTSFRTMRGDHVWAVRRDSLDVEQVVRLRVVPGFGERAIDVGSLGGSDRRVASTTTARRRRATPG